MQCSAVQCRGEREQGEILTIPDITGTIRAIRIRRGNNKAIVVRVCLIMENYLHKRASTSTGLNREELPFPTLISELMDIQVRNNG